LFRQNNSDGEGRRLKISLCLLDHRNPLIADGISIGRRILASGKKHLWDERENGSIDAVILHYTSAIAIASAQPFSLEENLKIFCDYGVSSHFFISRRGGTSRLVPEDKKAWHCGGSIMPSPDNRKGVNEFSLGIELAATPDSGFTESQYRAAARLCAGLEKKYEKKFVYLGHDRIAGARAVTLGLRKEPKEDPGPLFDWNFFFLQLKKARKSFL
jgi:N-acetyl-anhydromuramyl-L-alanine amidase AmpD